MAFPGKQYAPPGPYTQTLFESPVAGGLDTFKLPVIVGEGDESLVQTDLQVVRGSSSSEDQRVVGEDAAGRSVVSVNNVGVITLGSFDGLLDKIQVRHYPIVTGAGSGTTSNNRTDVSVTINGQPIVVRAVTGAAGIVQLAQAPAANDTVRVTYFFKRTDTLITDDVSEQVPAGQATVRAVKGLNDVAVGGTDTIQLYGDILGLDGQILFPANNVILATIDGTAYTLTLPPKVDYTMAQIATAITALNKGTLTGGTFVNQYGQSALVLRSDYSLSVGSGSANGLLGLLTGQADNRTTTFYTFNGPIVDGTNGGVTTTDPSHVTVKVNNRQVIPTSVDGASRSVTLAQAPKAGQTVTIQYYFNTWQDTWDYLAHVGITSVTKCGDVPGGSAYIEDADFILQDDKILWGTAATVANGTTTVGSTAFGENQITTTLVDEQTYMAECASNVSQSGGIATENRYEFVLPIQPTLGNGRNTPLGQSLFQTVSNGRIDLPVNRPDVIWVYWGYGLDDALARGRVEVLKVEGLVITLASPVPVGASVYATMYYNTLTDETYTVSVLNPGVSGVGTYTVQNSGGEDVVVPHYATASKGAGLVGVTVEFPSGSELAPDVRFETPFNTDDFTGPVEEIVTVRFEAREKSLARFTFPGSGPYEFIPDQSDHLAVTVHSTAINAAGIDLQAPSKVALHPGGYFGCLVSDEIAYEGGVATNPGAGYDIDGETFDLELDGVDVPVRTMVKTAATIADFVTSINLAAGGIHANVDAGQVANDTTVLLTAADTIGTAAAYNDYYKDWKIVVGNTATVAGVRGITRTITAFDAATSTLTVSPAFPANVTAADEFYLYNPATRAALAGKTKFNSPVTIAANKFDSLKIVYKGDVSTTATLTLTAGTALAAGIYATAADLAAEVTSKIAAQVALAAVGFKGLVIECVANADDQLEFRLQPAGNDSVGYIQFVTDAGAALEFAILAGIDAAAVVDTAQTILIQGPVAWYRTCAGTNDRLYDRLLIRNRILPGASVVPGYDSYSNAEAVKVKSTNVHAGLTVGMTSPSGYMATVHPATLTSQVGFSGGQKAVTFEPIITFYDGTGAHAANNTFNFELDGYPVAVTFADAGGAGTQWSLGPATGTSAANVILDAIIDAIAAIPGAPYGNAAAVYAAGLVYQYGAGIYLGSGRTDTLSKVSITSGSAVSLLGFVAGQTALRTLTSPKEVAAALMSNAESVLFTWMHVPSATDVGSFTNPNVNSFGIATTVFDDTGAEFLYIQDLPINAAALGTASNISVADTTGGIANALRYTTGLGALSGDGSVGDAAVSGFYVKSNVANGSGSIDNSILSAFGVGGQDGTVGQTYRDLVTGLTFTILPRGWATNKTGPWVAYPTGATATFLINVSKTFITDANIPNNAIPGLELTVANTYDATAGDTGIVTTFERGGNEPANGDVYYVTYVYTKQDFSTQFYSKMSSIEKAFGSATPDNPVSLAAYLAILNGAVVVGIKQVQRAEGENQASITTYRDAITELEGVLPGQIQPDIITLMRGDSTDLYTFLKKSCEIQSSIRYRAERTAIIGATAGTTPAGAMSLAQTLSSTRMRLVYPDMATLNIQDALGSTKEYLVDGPYLAAALTGSVVSPNVDVATPWTGRRLVGFTQLARQLDAVQANQVATKGVTILQDQPPFIKVRHGLTTDMTNILTKLPTIVMIADEVQRQARSVLEVFIGLKFLPGILSQIEGRLSMMMKALVSAQIITAYTGIKANVSADDPTVAEVEAFYSPVFPLLYIVLTFHLRSSL